MPTCPATFFVAAEVLALAIHQDAGISGLSIPEEGGDRHKFSAFVDKSTVFLHKARQLPRVMRIVEGFRRLSGLKMQPDKSKLIFLNLTLQREKVFGLPVLQPGTTNRYLI